MACRDEQERLALMMVAKGADIMVVQKWMKKHPSHSKNWVAGSVQFFT